MNNFDLGYNSAKKVLIERSRRGGMMAFTKLTKPDYSVNWHHDSTIQVLNKFLKKEIKRLIILEPPRYGKSELSSRRMPALIHGIYPNDEILAGSYNSDLAKDMTTDVQRIMDTEIYNEIFPLSRITPDGSKSQWARSSNEHELNPVEDNAKLYKPDFVYDKQKGFIYPRGSYRAAGVGGSFTGRGGNWLLIDDPVKNREDADSPGFRKTLWDWFRSTARTRLENEIRETPEELSEGQFSKDASICITMTHWHEDDLVGRILALMKNEPDADQYYVLRLPAIKEQETPLDVQEKKTNELICPNLKLIDSRKVGEPLWPQKFSIKNLGATKVSIGTRDFSALYQQRPTPEGGNIVQARWLKFYNGKITDCPLEIISCDMATKEKDSNDYYSYICLGKKDADIYLLGRMKFRRPFPEAVKKLVEFRAMYPRARRVYIESKANGPAVAQSLRLKMTGLIEVEPDGDKVARLNAVTPEMESGNFWVPNPEQNPWVNDYIAELIAFPGGANDDDVDSTSQGLKILQDAKPVYAPRSGHSAS
jgi:predicted phage terminase large subunit-like protein